MTPDFYTNGIIQVKAYRILQTQVAGLVKSYGFGSVSEWFVLSHVVNSQDVIAKDLAALLEVEAPLITRLVNNLIRDGLVSVQPHPTDKRVKFVRPTKRALQFAPKVQADLQTTIAQLLRGASQTDLKGYGKVLNAIIMNGEKL